MNSNDNQSSDFELVSETNSDFLPLQLFLVLWLTALTALFVWTWPERQDGRGGVPGSVIVDQQDERIILNRDGTRTGMVVTVDGVKRVIDLHPSPDAQRVPGLSGDELDREYWRGLADNIVDNSD